MSKPHYLLLLLSLGLSILLHHHATAQLIPGDGTDAIMGNTHVDKNSTHDYYFQPSTNYTNIRWAAAGGTVTNTWYSGGRHYARVKWTNVGVFNQLKIYRDYDVVMGSIAITVYPPSTTISGSSSPYDGEEITYYHQGTENPRLYSWQFTGGTMISESKEGKWVKIKWHTQGTHTLYLKYAITRGQYYTVASKSITVQPPAITGDLSVVHGETLTYSHNGLKTLSDYTWVPSGGTIVTENKSTRQVTINWTASGSLKLYYQGVLQRTANVMVLPVSITGPFISKYWKSESYSHNGQGTPGDYTWSADGGTVLSTSGTSATIRWTSAGNHKAKLYYKGALQKELNVTVSAPAIAGNNTLSHGDQATYTHDGGPSSNYTWSATGGEAIDPTGSQTGIRWTTPGSGSLNLYHNNTLVASYPVTVAAVTISGHAENQINDLRFYTHNGSGEGYTWQVDGGLIIAEDPASQTVTIRWTEPSGQVHLNKETVALNTIDVTNYSQPQVRAIEGTNLGSQSPLPLMAADSYPNYQWYRDGAALTSGVPSITVAQTGRYHLKVIMPSGFELTSNKIDIADEPFLEQNKNMMVSYSLKQSGITDPTQVRFLHDDQVSTTVDYLDGLGRPLQTVFKGASGTGKDIVQPYSYDYRGRSATSYLPYQAEQNTGYYRDLALENNLFARNYSESEQQVFYQEHPGTTHDSHPYAETRYDDTPRGRVLEQGSVGADWQPGTGHTTTYSYRYNSANTVLKWQSDGTASGYYGADQLMVSQVTDADGNQSITYTDSHGRTILSQTEQSAGSYSSTYYIYDEMGRLKYTVPPKAVETGLMDVTAATMSKYIFSYTYDDQGRLITKTTPGAGEEHLVYDQMDRVILTQDANLRASNSWAFVKYDRQGRAVYSGIYPTTATREEIQTQVDQLNYDQSDLWYESPAATPEGYTNQAFPTQNLQVLNVTYYDHYDFNRDGTDDYPYIPGQLNGQEAEAWPYVQHKVTGTKTLIMGTTDWLISLIYYDRHGRVIQSRSNNPKNLSVADVSTAVYDFDGTLTHSQATVNDGQRTLSITQRYVYDHAGRLTQLYHTIAGQPEQQIARYTYDVLGQPVRKELHRYADQSYLQAVDYSYNIRGWLTSINDPATTGDTQRFGLEIFYQNALGGGLDQTPAYNGSITAVKWKEHYGNNITGEQKAYSYNYDKMGRLTGAGYGEGTTHTGATGKYALDQVSYDANGNISHLSRKGPDPATGAPALIDDLTYTYDGNQLTRVDDAGTGSGFKEQGSSTLEYTYDNNGNMTADANKGVTAVQYNIFNKPTQITLDNGVTISYTYDGAGNKLSQTIDDNGTLTTREFAGGMIYENGQLQSFPHAEGRVLYHAGEYEYQYTLTDHLGNTRMMLTSEAKTTTFLATMETDANSQEDDQFFEIAPSSVTVHTAATSHDEVQRLYGTIAGAGAPPLMVYPGDKLTLSVEGFYGGGDGSSQVDAQALITAVAGLFGGVNGGTTEKQAIYNSFDNAINPLNGGFGTHTPDAENVAAYLNYIIFDKDMKVLQYGYEPMSGDAVGTPLTMEINTVSPGEGILYTYLTNESGTEVYFDDFSVTIEETPVVQSNAYYPFGLEHSSSWTRASPDASGKNDFLYNGGSELNRQTGNYETYFRDYDPALGRFTGVDIMAGKFHSWTPYQFAFNNPISYNDPMGDEPRLLREERSHTYEHMNWNFFSSGGAGGRIGPGSPNDWMAPFRSAETNFALMSTGAFKDFYGVDGMSDQERFSLASQLGSSSAGAFASLGLEVVTNQSYDPSISGGSMMPVHSLLLEGTFVANLGSGFYSEASAVTPDYSFGAGLSDGAIGGLEATWNLVTNDIWTAGFWGDQLHFALEVQSGRILKKAVDGVVNAAGNVQNMTAYDAGYATGYIAEKVVEAALLKRIAAGSATSASAPTGQYYSVAYEMTLSKKLYPGVNASRHFTAANKAMLSTLNASTRKSLNIVMKTRSNGSVVMNKSPHNWVWHHDVGNGVMQLVPKPQHTPGSIFWNTLHPGGKGGMAIWGGGY